MKFALLIVFFLSGCFFGPVQELHDQIEDTYFHDDFLDTPTPLKNLKNSVELEVIWQENIGEHDGSNLDIFYSNDFVYAASSSGTIKKLNIKTGDQSWEKNLDIKITSGVAGNDENLIFSTSDGFLWCMDHNGELLWKTLLDGEVNSLPIIYDSKIVVKLNSYKIVQFNIIDGSILWKYQAAIPPLTFKSEGKSVQSNKVIYLGLPGGKMIAIDSPTGGLVWESNISRAKGTTDIERANDITSHPVIDGSVIYGVTTNGDISSLDRRNGKTIWTRPISSFYGMAFDGLNLFVTHDTGSIYSIDKDDGEIKWRQADLKFRKIRAGIIAHDFIVFGDYDGYVHFVGIDDGKILGRIKLQDSQILNNIIKIDESLLLLMSAEGDITCLKVGTEVINNQLLENDDKEESTNDEGVERNPNNSQKHRIFDNDKEELFEEDLDEEEKKSIRNKKHRVFDKKEKGFLDWLF